MFLMESENTDCDPLNEAKEKQEGAENVRILSNTSSFFISVDNSDDSDWDEINDSELLSDLSDFELTGLYVTNLTSHTGDSSISAASSHNDKLQILHLNTFLVSVNNEWNRATKELDEEFRSPAKAPDKLLVVKRICKTAYQPQSNGFIEEFHRPLKAENMCHSTEKWTEVLPHFPLDFRASLKENKGCPSAKLAYGKNLQISRIFRQHSSRWRSNSAH
ncbi:hypothetical protein NPIL_167981 [Nephila pilipes]|uniref:Integrase catalytic domain-containing protein n=1 Tax=Nephila pilipes TaxID=299642 RepID=A0A8X6U602_NEPPI|nr:hypothetical protein NPIL_167981 [Nephila pilipes]